MATAAATRSAPSAGSQARVLAALARRTTIDDRVRTVAFGWLFLAVAYAQPVAYRHTYASLADRIRFAHSFADNKAVVFFYGRAYDLLTVGGYTAWRVGGTLAIFAAVFGVLAAVRALRAQEDGGPAELVLASAVGRGAAFGAALTAIAGATGALWLMTFAGLLAGGLPAGGAAYLALAVASVVPVFVGVGAIASQLASTRRLAAELGGAIVALCFLLRVIADTSHGAGWLRWLTPLGWAEELRPFSGVHPLVLLAPAAASAALIAIAARLGRDRDLGTGVLAVHDTPRPRFALLSSSTAQAFRGERLGLLIWTGGIGAMALVTGTVSKSVSSLGVSKQLGRTLEKLGVGSVLTPKAYIGFSLSALAIAVCLFAVGQMAAARHEEESERLEALLALPVGRGTWLGGRLGLAVAGIVLISLCAGLFAWAGAVSQGVSLSLATMLGAGANCIPAAVLFAGVAALCYAIVPRRAAAVAYGIVVVSYLWQLFGSLLGAPRWLVRATPFAHVAAVPAVAFRPGAAMIMVIIGVAASLTAIALFRRRDVTGA